MRTFKTEKRTFKTEKRTFLYPYYNWDPKENFFIQNFIFYLIQQSLNYRELLDFLRKNWELLFLILRTKRELFRLRKNWEVNYK